LNLTAEFESCSAYHSVKRFAPFQALSTWISSIQAAPPHLGHHFGASRRVALGAKPHDVAAQVEIESRT
jgi:hypothetical protein